MSNGLSSLRRRIRRMALRATGRVRRHDMFLSLGYDCEPAFRYLVANGFCKEAVFQGGGFASLSELVRGLEHWDLVHGPKEPGLHMRYRSAESADAMPAVPAPIKKLKQDFVTHLQAGGALLVCKIRPEEWADADCPRLLKRLHAALRAMGGNDFDLVLVLEASSKRISRTLDEPRTFVRFVRSFCPVDCDSDPAYGDGLGWKTLFDEFEPASPNGMPMEKLTAGKKVLCIKKQDPHGGLFSQFAYSLGWMKWAVEHGMTPHVDPVSSFAWNRYFEQEHVALDNDAVAHIPAESFPDDWPNPNACAAWLREGDSRLKTWRRFVADHVRVTAAMSRQVDEAEKKLFAGETRVLGCLVRGTDYLKMKPKWHPVQPDPEEVVREARKVCDERGLKKVFLASEDEGVRNIFRREFGDDLLIWQNELPAYETGYLLSSGALGAADRAVRLADQYFISVLLLARCPCLLAGCTSGSLGAMLFSRGYEWSHIYDLGTYA